MILAELENHKGMPIIGDKNGSTNFTEEKMKFAFLMIGNSDCEVDRATIHHAHAQIIGVANIEEACTVAKNLYKE